MDALKDYIHLAGYYSESGVWYYPPLILDEHGYLWGSCADHLDRMFENRMAMRYYYRSVQPDAPISVLGRRTHVTVALDFVDNLVTYYQPLMSAERLPHELKIQAVALLSEAKVLCNFLRSLRL